MFAGRGGWKVVKRALLCGAAWDGVVAGWMAGAYIAL